MRKNQYTFLRGTAMALMLLPLASQAQTSGQDQKTTAEPKKAKVMILQKEDGEYLLLDTTFMLAPGMTANQAVEKMKLENKSLKRLGAKKIEATTLGSPKDNDAIHVIASRLKDSTSTRFFRVALADTLRNMVFRMSPGDSVVQGLKGNRIIYQGDSVVNVKGVRARSITIAGNPENFTKNFTIDSLVNTAMTIRLGNGFHQRIDSLTKNRIRIVRDDASGQINVIGLKKGGEVLASGDYEVVTIDSGDNQKVIVLRHTKTEDNKVKQKKTNKKVKTPDAKMDVQVYPNPTGGTVSLSFAVDKKADTKVRVVNSQGKAVFEDEKRNFQGRYTREIDLGKFGAGLYVIQLMVGKTVQAEKVLVR